MQIRRREQEVWQACDDLWALSGNLSDLTGDAIRERLLLLGKSKGSPNEIYKYRKSWEENRQIQRNTNNAEISDPISRAVKLVHEQLQVESQEKIDSIKEDFLARHKAYEEEILKVKKDFADLLKEYELVHDKSVKQEDKIEVLMLEKQAFLQQISSLEQKNLQDKMLYEQQITMLQTSNLENTALYEKNLQASQIAIADMQDKQIKLGQEYSESLIEIKTQLYNAKIATQKEIEQNELINKKNISLSNQLQAYQEKIIAMERTIFANMQVNEQTNKRLEEVLQENQELKQQVLVLLNQRQKNSSSIAKLRAMLRGS